MEDNLKASMDNPKDNLDFLLVDNPKDNLKDPQFGAIEPHGLPSTTTCAALRSFSKFKVGIMPSIPIEMEPWIKEKWDEHCNKPR